MDQVLARPKIQGYIIEHFVPVKVNYDSDKETVKEFGVQAIPDLWFLDSTGEKLKRVNGFIEEDALFPMLEYMASDVFLQMSLKAFLRQN